MGAEEDSLIKANCQSHCHDCHYMNYLRIVGVIDDHHNFSITTYLNRDAIKTTFVAIYSKYNHRNV